MSLAAIGIDLGGTNLRLGRVSTDGRLERRIVEPVTRDPAAVMARLVVLCRDSADTGVEAIGIGIPGRVDAARRRVLSGGYLDLSHTRIAERIEDATGRRVTIDNDCNMALVAEMARGAAIGRANVVMFTIGTGIGGAVALDGHIARGTGTAGQLGHLQVVGDGLLCNCGRRGCVETTSSGTALARLVSDAGLAPQTRIETLLANAELGDALSAGVVDRWVGPLRSAIDSMVAALAPDLVVLGGGLGGAALTALRRAPAPSAWYPCPVVAAALNDDAGMIGAGLSALRSVDIPTAALEA